MNNLKKQLVEQAIKTQKPEETLDMLYCQNKLEPAKHYNPITKKYFHGKNIWTLEINYILNDFTSCEWSTFAQYKANKTPVAKGAKSTYLTLAVYNKQKDENGEEKETFQFYKGYSVFNKEQTKAQEEVKTEVKTTAKEVKEVNKQLNLWIAKGIEAVA